MKLVRRAPSIVLGGLALALLALPTGAAGEEATLESILARFDEVQDSIRTLSAEFTETTSNPLLVEPLRSEGRFYMTKPDAIRWEYTSPEEMRFVIAQDRYTGYFPKQHRAETRNIQRWSDQIFRFFGLGQGSAELSKFYTISSAEAENALPGTWLLRLAPKKRRVRKRVDEVMFWLDRTTHLPVRVEYVSQDGLRREVRFRKILVNPDLAAGIYTVEIPAGIRISRGFSGLPGVDPDPAR